MIPKSIDPMFLKIDFVTYPRMTPYTLQPLKDSMTQFGYYTTEQYAVVIDEDLNVITGKLRVLAARELGIDVHYIMVVL